MQLETASAGSLREGTLLVSILQPDAEFSVETPVGELLHYGTEYGVSVGPTGATEMYVYEGMVEVRPPAIGLSPQSSRLVRQGGVVEIQPSGQVNGSLAAQAPEPFEVFHKSVGSSSKPASYEPRLPFVSDERLTVRFVKSASIPINSIDKADDLLAGRIPSAKEVTAERMEQVNLRGGPWDPVYMDLFPNNVPFPGHNPDKEEQDFVFLAKGTLLVRDSWRYSFVVNVDDGGRLRIDGQDVILDNGIHPPQISLGVVTLARGAHTLELIYYNNGGTAQLELGIAVGETKHLQDFSPLSIRPEKNR